MNQGQSPSRKVGLDDEGYGMHDEMQENIHDLMQGNDGGIGFEDGQLNDGGFAAMGFDNQGANIIR